MAFVALAAKFLCGQAIGQTVDVFPHAKQEVLDRIASIMTQSAFVPGVDFTKWPGLIAEQKAAIEASKNDEEFRTAVNAALKKLGTSHAVLLTPRSSQARRSGATVGIGVSIQNLPEGFAVVRVVKDGPAEKAGIVVGDTIVQIDGKPVAATTNLSGEEGSEVQIRVKRADGTFEDIKLTRTKYSTLRPPELTWVDADTALLKIYSFETAYEPFYVADLMRDALRAKNLILDLRYNGGGAVRNLQHLLGMLIPDSKPVGTFIRRSTVADYIESTGSEGTDVAAIAEWSERKFKPLHRVDLPMFSGKLVVLINKFSGSASEIAAAGLHDVLGTPIIGAKSAGAVLASVVDPVSNGFSLQYPIEDYVTIKGMRLEGIGVTPDILAQDPNLRQPNGADEGITKAVAYFAAAKQGKNN